MMKKLKISLFFVLYAISYQQLFAQEFRYLARSPHALLMGDAFTALADDEYTLFYNPAALARNYGVSLTPINATIGVTNALDDLDRFRDFPSDAVDIAERVMDYPLYTHFSTAPGFKVGGLGFSLMASSTSTLLLKNSTHPMLDIDYRYDRGFVLGYAFDITSSGPRMTAMRRPYGHRLSFGASVKHIHRDGIADSYSFFGTRVLNIINNASSYKEIREGLGYSKGKAWGTDFGLEYGLHTRNSEFLMGLSLMDFLDTKFKRYEGTAPIPEQKMNLNFGTAYRQHFGPFHYTLSFDLHPILEPMDYRRKLHFGTKIGTPLFDLYGGWSGGYLSYGASVKLWPFKVSAGFYSTEIGADYNDNRASRAIIYLSLLDTKLSF